MGIFGTSRADLIKEVAKTGALLTAALNDLHIERTQHGHTKAELAKYKRGLSMGTEASAARRRFDKECREQVVDRKAGTGAFAKPNGTAAAVQGVEL